jgi:hypothetical protein
MLFLAKVAAIAVIVWFYLTAQKNNQPTIQWAVIGFIGYAITWGLVKLTAVNALLHGVEKSFIGTFIVTQIPALCAIAVAFFVRKKLLADANKPKDDSL